MNNTELIVWDQDFIRNIIYLLHLARIQCTDGFSCSKIDSWIFQMWDSQIYYSNLELHNFTVILTFADTSFQASLLFNLYIKCLSLNNWTFTLKFKQSNQLYDQLSTLVASIFVSWNRFVGSFHSIIFKYRNIDRAFSIWMGFWLVWMEHPEFVICPFLIIFLFWRVPNAIRNYIIIIRFGSYFFVTFENIKLINRVVLSIFNCLMRRN